MCVSTCVHLFVRVYKCVCGKQVGDGAQGESGWVQLERALCVTQRGLGHSTGAPSRQVEAASFSFELKDDCLHSTLL